MFVRHYILRFRFDVFYFGTVGDTDCRGGVETFAVPGPVEVRLGVGDEGEGGGYMGGWTGEGWKGFAGGGSEHFRILYLLSILPRECVEGGTV